MAGLPGLYTQGYIGRRDREHIARWHAALRAGTAAAPRCEALTRAGRPCGHLRLRGSRFCRLHCKGAERDRLDVLREPQLVRLSRKSGLTGLDARAQLEAIQRRRLHRLWQTSPNLPGATIHLAPADLDRVRVVLQQAFGFDLDDEGLTCRAYDRAL
jgi:hypothetical protein